MWGLLAAAAQALLIPACRITQYCQLSCADQLASAAAIAAGRVCVSAAGQVEALKARPGVEVISVTRANRDALVGQLVERLSPALA
jgi:hypothetical protein